MTITAIIPKIFSTETTKLSELFAQRKTLADQISSVDKAILDEAVKTSGYAFLKGISGGGNIPVGRIEGNFIAYELNAYNLDQRFTKQAEKPAAAYKPTLSSQIAQLGEKTLNSLLNGKTLSANEKRKLVQAMLPTGIIGTEATPEPDPEDEFDDRPF